MPDKLVPPETWQGFPVEPCGSYCYRYWILKEKYIGVGLELGGNGGYAVVYFTPKGRQMLLNENGSEHQVYRQEDFQLSLDKAKAKIVEAYASLIEEAVGLAKANSEKAKSLLADMTVVAAVEQQEELDIFWDRLGC